MWAITPRGVGAAPAYRAIEEGTPLAPDEFATTQDPVGMVLADDGVSLRAPTNAEMLGAAKAARLEVLVRARDAAIISPVEWSGALWSTLPEDQANLIQAVALWSAARGLGEAEQLTLGAPVPTVIPWKTVDNQMRELGYLEAVQLATAVSIHKQTMFGVYWQLEQGVNAATSLEEIAAIGWP